MHFISKVLGTFTDTKAYRHSLSSEWIFSKAHFLKLFSIKAKLATSWASNLLLFSLLLRPTGWCKNKQHAKSESHVFDKKWKTRSIFNFYEYLISFGTIFDHFSVVWLNFLKLPSPFYAFLSYFCTISVPPENNWSTILFLYYAL